jgi:SAM-dependent methyltransferase
MGQRVTAFDIHVDLNGCIEGRVSADARIDPSLIDFATGDGHKMPFPDAAFGHLLCYDTLHHMRDFDSIFHEYARVLKPGGRAIFVEPGDKHASSPETIEFLKLKAHDSTWIERNIVLEEIDVCARGAKFNGPTMVPLPHAEQLERFRPADWLAFRKGSRLRRARFANRMAQINYNERVVFFCDK